MEISLTEEQSAWLATRVAAGEFPSVEQAVRSILDDLMEEAIDTQDLDWAKPLVDEALASVARGDTIPLEEHRARTAALLAKLRRG